MSHYSETGLTGLKSQARRLRAALQEDGVAVSHSGALELIARQHGDRDWNTLSAKARRASAAEAEAPPARVGETRSGRYLGHAFTGRVTGVSELARGRYRVSVQFDAPLDVVAFESFSSLRSRVSEVVDPTGRGVRKTSNGAPVLALDPPRARAD